MGDRADTERDPKILFVPVSSPRGVGEYVRSLTIARAAQTTWPRADIRFIVSKQAPYAGAVPYTAFLTERSPTKHIHEVNRIVSEFRPEIVVFDCSGRAAQLRHASCLGCATVFVSQHRRKRSRGFKNSRMRFTDLHWIVQPSFVVGDLTRWERLKLKLFGRPQVSFIGPVFPPAKLPSPGLPDAPFFFCCAGGGGNMVGERNSAELFAEAASKVARTTGMAGVMVMGPNYKGEMDSLPGLTIVPKMSGPEVTYVLKKAEFAMLAGGDMLGHAVAMGTPCVAAAVAKDQAARIAAYARRGLSLAADPLQLAAVTLERLTEEEREGLRRRMEAAGLRNGLAEAMEQLAGLVERGGVPA